MILEIKEVRRCRNGAYGNFFVRGRESALITLSLRKNPMLADYMSTLLHELLHCYTTLARSKGFRITDKREHAWIEACEVAVTNEMKKFFRRRK